MADDGITYLPNGMVRLVVDGVEIMLRRIKLGELKQLVEQLHMNNDRITARTSVEFAKQRTIRARLDRLHDTLQDQIDVATEAEDWDHVGQLELERAEQTAKLRQEDMAIGRETNRFADDVRFEWLRDVVSTLAVKGDVSLPDGDEVPGWLMDPTVPAKLIEHWRSVPSGSGSQ